MNDLSHVDQDNKPTMVDVSDKQKQKRIAVASGIIHLNGETIKKISGNEIKKGNVLSIAETAGIMAAKKTSDLIPLCHPLLLTNIKVRAKLIENGVEVISTITCLGQTGVEMEALSAVSVALLTIYDMCKAVDKEMVISRIKLDSKTKEDITK